jgi:steroid delta-isomerase-like uncharacterized protein
MSVSPVQLTRRWFEEVWNQRRDDAIAELISPACTGFMQGHGDVYRLEDVAAVRARFLAAFPDLSVEVEDVVAEGAKVVARWVAHGTHKGSALGIQPSGQRCEFRGLTWLEFEGGKVVRGWDSWDQGGLLEKLRSHGTRSARDRNPGDQGETPR